MHTVIIISYTDKRMAAKKDIAVVAMQPIGHFRAAAGTIARSSSITLHALYILSISAMAIALSI